MLKVNPHEMQSTPVPGRGGQPGGRIHRALGWKPSHPRIGLSVTQAGNAGIALLGRGITRAALSLDQQNRAGLFIYGANGKLAASVP